MYIYIYTEFAHLQDKGIDKIDGLKLYRKQNSTHTDIYMLAAISEIRH